MMDFNDIEWLALSWQMKLDLAQRIHDAIIPPRRYTRELEALMGADMERIEFLLEDGRVVDVFVRGERTDEQLAAFFDGKPWQAFGDPRKLQGYSRETASK